MRVPKRMQESLSAMPRAPADQVLLLHEWIRTGNPKHGLEIDSKSWASNSRFIGKIRSSNGRDIVHPFEL